MGLNQYDDTVEALTDGNPFAASVGRVVGRQTTGVTVATQQAAPLSPDKAAETEKIAAHFRVPPSIVAGHFEAFKSRYDSERTASTLQNAPAVASWMQQNPNHAALAKDDLEPLTTFEKTLRYGRNVAGAAGAGLLGALSGAYGAEQAAGEALGFPNFAASAAGKAQATQRLADRLRGPQEGAGLVERGIYGGIESVGQMAPALILGLLSGGASMLGTIGVTTGGQTYAQARQQGQTIGKSQAAGAIQGIVEVGTEFIPAHRLLGDLAKRSGVIATLAHQFFPEIAGEEIATALQDLNEYYLLPANKDKTFSDYLAERPSAATATAISTIVAVGATTIAGHGARRFVEKLGETATESKTVQRAPEKAQEFIAQALEGSPAETMYAPIDTFTSYWQSKGLDPKVIAEQLTGNPDAYAQAVATGHDLPIPTAAYAVQIGPTEHNAFFANELRLAPEQMNAREAGAFEKAATEAQAATPETVPATTTEPIRANIVSQLQAAGFEPSTAESYATLYESAFGTLGQRAGVDPVELFNRYGLKIERAGLDTGTAQAQDKGSNAATEAATGPVVSNRPAEQPRADQGGNREGQGNGPGAESRRIHAPAGIDEQFVRRPLADTQARLTPEVRREIERIRDEMDTFPFVGRTWNWLGDATARYGGNAAGGNADVVAGSAGAAVYHDVLGFAPLNKVTSGKRKGELARENTSTRAQVMGAIAKLLETGDVHNNLAEGVLRVAENRAAGHYADMSAPELPPSWGTVAPAEFTDALSEAIDQALESDAVDTGGEDVSFDPTSFEQGERGRITFGNQQVRIDLFQNADLSTTIHESAHLFLQVMRDLASQSGQIAADLQTIADVYGTDNVEQHEGFATAFEAYLMEGKAPSAELRGVFARFRAWLVGVYRSLKGLNVTLTPEVRQVFDRLLATDDAIQQAEAQGDVRPLFTDAASAGMTEAEFAKYRATVADASEQARADLEQQALAAVQRERQAWWNTEKKAVRATVESELREQPVYKARAALREELKGVDLDIVAEMFGFSSGDELSRALKSTAPLPRAIAAETNARMTAKYGDVLLDGRFAEQATEAVFAHRGRVVQAELAALNRGLAAGAIPPASVIRSIAEQRIGSTRIRDLKPGLFLMAAQRASAKAFDLKDSDRVAAVQAKQQELVNLALYREALSAKDRIDSAVAYLRSFDAQPARERIGKAGGDYLEQIDGLRERFDLARVTQKTIDRRAALSAWVSQQEAQGLPVDIPAELLNDARRVNYQSLTVDEIQGVRDVVQAIAHLARLKNRLLTNANKRTFDEAIGDITTSIAEHNTVKKLPLEFLPKDQKARKVADWFASHEKLSTFVHALDGYQDGGALWEHVLRPINEAATREAAMNTEATTQLSALMTEAYTGRELGHLHDKLFIPAINDSLSKEARLAVALNWGNEGNRQRIRDGRHWTDAQVQAILGTLDARDAKFVQGVWDFINSYWGDIAAKQKRVTGIAPEKVEPSPLTIAGEQLRGGYYPLVYDSRLSARAGSFIEANDATLQKQAAYVKATTKRGHTEARVAHVSEPVRLELSVLYGHVEQVIHDLSHHEMLIDVGRILGDKRVQQAIYQTQGDQVYQQFKNTLKDIAYGVRPAADAIEKSLNFIRQGTTVAGLAWNLWTAVQQPLGVFDGMYRVGPSWVLKGMGRMLRDATSMENTAAWIYSQSEMMKLRGGTYQREVAELRTTLSHPGGWFDNALRTVTLDHLTRQDIEESYFFFIEMAQRMADYPTFLGQYEKSRAAGEPHERAIKLAEQAVLDAQGGGQIKDLAEAQRGGPAVKLFTNFYSYGNLKYNQTVDAFGKTNFRKAGSVGQLLGNMLLLYTMPAAMTVLLAKAFGRDDDKDSFIVAMGKEMLGAALNTMVLVRELGGFVRQANRGYEGPTGTRMIKTAYDLGTQLEQGKADRGLLRASEDAAGILFRLPAAQVQRSVDGFVALQAGKTHNPLALVAGPPKGTR